MTISMLDFLREGCFGPIIIGDTKIEIEKHLGPPDEWELNEHASHGLIWKYGNFEFHFNSREAGREARLELIFIEVFEASFADTGGYDTWVLENGMKLSEVRKALRQENIEFEMALDPWKERRTLLKCVSGVELAFDTNLDWELGLSEVSLAVV